MAADVTDPVFEEEQRHLSETYATLLSMRDSLSEELESKHKGIAQDLIDMSEEISLDFVGADETMETLAAIETLNSVIDTYNQYHDYTVDKVRRILLLLMDEFFIQRVGKIFYEKVRNRCHQQHTKDKNPERNHCRLFRGASGSKWFG